MLGLQQMPKMSFGSKNFIGNKRAFFRRSNVSDEENSIRLYTALGIQKSAGDGEIKR